MATNPMRVYTYTINKLLHQSYSNNDETFTQYAISNVYQNVNQSQVIRTVNKNNKLVNSAPIH